MSRLLGMLIAFLGFSSDSYGQQLESYITSRNPKDAGDVERLTYEFNQKQANQRFFL